MNNIFNQYIKVKEESEIEIDFSLKEEIKSHKYYFFFLDLISTIIVVLFGLFLFKSSSINTILGEVWVFFFIVQLMFYVFQSFFYIVQGDIFFEYSDKKYDYKSVFVLVGSAALAFSSLIPFQNLISTEIQSFIKSEVLEMSENAFNILFTLSAKAFSLISNSLYNSFKNDLTKFPYLGVSSIISTK